MSGRKTLRVNATGSEVAELQALLIRRGYALDDDGMFGRITEMALRNYQTRAGLLADGIAGPATWAKLDAPEAAAPINEVSTGYSIENDRLLRNGVPVRYRDTPNGRGVIVPRWLVIHFTAGFYEGSIAWMTTPGTEASAHLCIGEAAEITQLAPFNRRCYHAGKSAWRGVSMLNSHSIGFELANLGNLSGGPGAYRFGTRAVPDNRVMRAPHRNGGPVTAWHTFPEAQFAAAADAARAVCAAYGIAEIVGHDDIAPGRKSDPGPAFDMAKFRKIVFG